MANSPQFKVYRNGIYIASCKHPEDAAAIIAATSQDKQDKDYQGSPFHFYTSFIGWVFTYYIF